MPHTRARASYRRILAVKLADLGDLLTVTPALQALRAAHPGARIDLLTPLSSAQLLRGAPYLDDVITFDKFAFDSLGGLLDMGKVLHTLRFLLKLRLSSYDALVIFHHFTTRWGALKFGILSLASGAPSRAGLDNGRGRCLTLRAEDKGFGAKHEAGYWLEVASLLGADAEGGWRTNIPINANHRTAVLRLLQSKGVNRDSAQPLVAMHPGAGAYSRARIWPVERLAAVARGLVEQESATVIIVGGPDEIEAAAVLAKVAGCDYNGETSIHNFAGDTSIHETAALIELCDLFVGNDSGPMHIAAAVGTPVVAVFGPSNQQAWGPYTPPGEYNPHKIVSRELPCMPCFYRVHSLGLQEGCGPRPCLAELPSGPVLAACREALGQS